jgi:hypothetical protein
MITWKRSPTQSSADDNTDRSNGWSDVHRPVTKEEAETCGDAR